VFTDPLPSNGRPIFEHVRLRGNVFTEALPIIGSIRHNTVKSVNFTFYCTTTVNFPTFLYSKTCLKRNLKGPEHFSGEARFPFNQGML
jgi:hypothetical protein